MSDKTAATKRQIKSLMLRNKVPGSLSGRGEAWEVELPDDKAKKMFERLVEKPLGISVGGYRTGFGGWVLRPGYKTDGLDYNNPASRHHYAARKDRLGTPWPWMMHNGPDGDTVYILKDHRFTVEKRYTGIEEDKKISFRVAPDEYSDGWRLDYWDFMWVALTNKVFRTPRDAAQALEPILEGDNLWTKNASGWEPGTVTNDTGWEAGERAPEKMESLGEGSETPPVRDDQGNELDENGNPVSSIPRVASVEDEWENLRLANQQFRQR